MKAWRGWVLAVGLAAGGAVAQSPADSIVKQLQQQGYVEFTVSWTLLGRIHVVAVALDGSQREIVFNPATGEILRDYSRAADGSSTPLILDRSEEGDDDLEPAASANSDDDDDGRPSGDDDDAGDDDTGGDADDDGNDGSEEPDDD